MTLTIISRRLKLYNLFMQLKMAYITPTFKLILFKCYCFAHEIYLFTVEETIIAG